MEASRDDFVIAIRSAFIQRGNKQRFSLFFLLILSIILLTLGRYNFSAINYIKIFTLLEKEAILKITEEHELNPHQRLLQKTLAEEVTLMVHGTDDLENAKVASQILFGQTDKDSLKKIDSQTFLEIFESVPNAGINLELLNKGIDIISLLSEKTNFLKSKSEVRRSLKENSISVNRLKVDESFIVSKKDIIADNCILIQRGKKNYFLIKVVI